MEKVNKRDLLGKYVKFLISGRKLHYGRVTSIEFSVALSNMKNNHMHEDKLIPCTITYTLPTPKKGKKK